MRPPQWGAAMIVRAGKHPMLKQLFRTALVVAFGWNATRAESQSIVTGGAMTNPTMAVPAGSVQGMQGSSGVNTLSQNAPGTVTSADSGGIRIYGSVEYLVWDISNRSVKIPIGSMGANGSLGVLGDQGASILDSGSQKYDSSAPGLKIAFGMWYDEEHSMGSDFNIMWMFSQSRGITQQGDPNGNTVISRPFFDTLFGGENARLLSVPGFYNGGYSTKSEVRLWGAEINPFIVKIAGDNISSLYYQIGFKYLYLNESYTITDSTTSVNGSPVSFNGVSYGQGFTTSIIDRVVASNNFYGGTLGLKWHAEANRISFDVTGKIALGGNEEVVDVYGSSRLLSSNRTLLSSPGGLLALPSNSGKFDTYKITAIPELNAAIGFKIVEGLTVHLSYNYLYMTSSVRAVDQLAYRNVNSGQVPTNPNFGLLGGVIAPARYLQRTEFSAQSIGLGATLSY